MTVTKHPTGQDLICLVCHKQAQDIDHVVNRGMGGSKKRDVPENKVPLCRECHTAKTNGVLETRVEPWTGGLNYLWRRKNAAASWIITPVEVSQRYKCLVGRLSDGAEVSDAPASSPGPSASSLSPKEESDGERQDSASDTEGLSAGTAKGPTATLNSGPSGELYVAPAPIADSGASPSLTHEQRVAIAKDIKDTEWNRQWIAGDTANQWRAELGEEAEQYLSDFGYVELSLANIMRVCERIPKVMRRPGLRFSHHVVVAGGSGNLEDIDETLAECEREGWSVAEFRRQVKGTKPKVKRWAVQELTEQYEANRTFASIETTMDFIRWLGDEQ